MPSSQANANLMRRTLLAHIDTLNTTITDLRQLLSRAQIGRNAARLGLEAVRRLLRNKKDQVQQLHTERDALQDLRPRCSICHELYRANTDDTKARIYPCGHSACSWCINQMINTRNAEAATNPRTNRNIIKCPHCREETKMIQPEAEKMIRNVALEQQ
ncbi:hypothetical protein GCK72_011156 [Caenorhabditis remanei]|uniref:RING-type domain-containing protein n=1 Tax=Caenorhabditis remanei TaxID=31234 RepID=A0A6A5H913_CAERE|nr:hypothetical protein GCK72_011156 [Caenorhabditis remanei]KAF1762892.1 hypothetical protein GCK72_011156 [Caenorhabditis remanei]